MSSSPHVISIILQIPTVLVNRLFRPDFIVLFQNIKVIVGLHLDRLSVVCAHCVLLLYFYLTPYFLFLDVGYGVIIPEFTE